jgi:hypothetical protein
MQSKAVISLVKELEKIRSIRSRNSYFGAWFGFIISIIGLAKLYMFSIEEVPAKGLAWFPTFMFVVVLVICLQSFYLIIRYVSNKKFEIIIEALLEKNKEK